MAGDQRQNRSYDRAEEVAHLLSSREEFLVVLRGVCDRSLAAIERFVLTTTPSASDRGKRWAFIEDAPPSRHAAIALRDKHLSHDGCITGTRSSRRHSILICRLSRFCSMRRPRSCLMCGMHGMSRSCVKIGIPYWGPINPPSSDALRSGHATRPFLAPWARGRLMQFKLDENLPPSAGRSASQSRPWRDHPPERNARLDSGACSACRNGYIKGCFRLEAGRGTHSEARAAHPQQG